MVALKAVVTLAAVARVLAVREVVEQVVALRVAEATVEGLVAVAQAVDN